MPRPLWTDHAPDVEAVAAYLEACAQAPGAARFEPVDISGQDLQVLHDAAILRAKRQVATRHGEKDRILTQEVRAVDDLVRAANLLVERLREWYALHAPEAVRVVTDAERLTTLVAQHGERAALLAALEDVRDVHVTLGSDLDAADLAVLQGFAQALEGVHTSWRAVEARVADLMTEVAPHVAAVAGPVLGARLIAQAGSLQRLASLPSGTVQVLGAETALFRHIKEGTRPPKHGFLFQHPLVFAAPPWQRGPIARALGNTVTLAARSDAFGDTDRTAEWTARLEREVARIRRGRAKPPARSGPGGPGRGGPRRGGGPGGRGGPKDGRSGGRSDGRSGGRSGGYGGPSAKGGTRSGHPRHKGKGKPGGPGSGPGRGGGKPGGRPRRIPGAFRGNGGPARPPGRGGGDKDDKKGKGAGKEDKA